ncbi:MAG: cohesin domain-containing protein, partial [Bryobacteraceae bacterium]
PVVVETPAAPPATAPPEQPKPAEPAKPSTRIVFTPGSAEGQLGGAISLSLTVENAADVFNTPMKIKYDPKVVHLNDVTAGPLLQSDGLRMAPTVKNIQNDIGEATILLSRLPGAGGLGGSGVLCTFVFQAVGRGSTPVQFPELVLRNSRLAQIATASPEATITVK